MVTNTRFTVWEVKLVLKFGNTCWCWYGVHFLPYRPQYVILNTCWGMFSILNIAMIQNIFKRTLCFCDFFSRVLSLRFFFFWKDWITPLKGFYNQYLFVWKRWLRKAAEIRHKQDANNDAVASSTYYKSGKRKGNADHSPAMDSYKVELGNAFLSRISFYYSEITNSAPFRHSVEIDRN